MISGTTFVPEGPEAIDAAFARIRHRIASTSDIEDLKAQCAEGNALCAACEDGVVVFSLQTYGMGLELFVWLAVASRPGAFERQEPALLKIARDLGAETLAFQTRRPGWGRHLGPQWQRRGSAEFMRYVDGRR